MKHVSMTKTIFLAASLLYIAVPAIQTVMTPTRSLVSAESDKNRMERNTSAFAIMLGEFRTSIGDMLFIKTERYLDSGIGYEPHIDAREMERTGSADHDASLPGGDLDASLATPEMKEAAGIAPGTVAVEAHNAHDHHEHAHEDEHDHDEHAHDDHGHDEHAHDEHGHDEHGDEHAGVKTLIRTADADFRGFIGKLERKVKPWRDPNEPHQHTAGTELLPWYKLATMSDPHNVRNYMIGAWWLKTLNTPEQLEEALKFLNEGIAANPGAYDLYLMKGYVLREMGKLKEARSSFRKSAVVGLEHRPPGGSTANKPEWDVTDDEQLAGAMNMEIMMIRDMESTATAISRTREYMNKLPEEGALKRIMQSLQDEN